MEEVHVNAEEFIVPRDNMFVCSLCHDYTPAPRFTVKRHILQLHFNHSETHNGQSIVLCKLLCRKDSHYHCICGCNKIFIKRARIKTHLETVRRHKSSSGILNVSVVEPKEDQVEKVKSSGNSDKVDEIKVGGMIKKVKCPSCDIAISKKNLRKHMERKHSKSDLHSKHLLSGTCVDEKQGIYLVSETKSGPGYPVHVQKLVQGDNSKMNCESKSCSIGQVIAGISGNMSSDCIHLQSVSNCSILPPLNLDEAVLDSLVQSKRIGEETKQSCLLQRMLANGSGCVPVHGMGTTGDRWLFISVWEPKKTHYAKLGRVSLTYDRLKSDLICNCSHSSRISCKHKPMAKWYLFSLDPNLTLNDKTTVSRSSYQVGLMKHFEWEVEYLSQKKIDIENLDRCQSRCEEITLKPSEEFCVKCLQALELKDIEGNSKLLTFHGYVQVKVYFKYCSNCNLNYHYSAIDHGIFNFNSHFLVSLHLLVWLRNANYVHTAISRELETLQFQLNCLIDIDMVRKTFYKFLALINYKDSFHCFICGYHPYLLTFDVNRKVCFKIDNKNEVHPKRPEINGREFWDNLEKHFVSQDRNSSIIIKPSLSYWAPYIGEHCVRKDGIALNSEYLKAGQDQVDEQQYLECLSEETLENIFDAEVPVLRDLCRKCGISANGLSKANCILRLTKALKDKTKIDKFFFKNWHSSGGLLTGTCEHGIVYAFKSLLCPESTRDYGDLLLSMQFPPTVIISDVPHMLAAHVNKRVPDFFSPYCGRVVEPSDDNVKLAKDDKLPSQSFPYLMKRMEKAVQPSKEAVFSCNSHPVTHTNSRLSLYDKFHERNTKIAKEYLRRTGHILELDGVITETAEQLNSYLSNSIYFLDVCSPAVHLLLIRNMLAMRNNEINKRNTGIIPTPHTFDVLGRILTSKAKCYDQQSFQSSRSPSSDIHFETTTVTPDVQNTAPEDLVDHVNDLKRHASIDKTCSKFSKIDSSVTLFDLIRILYKGLENPMSNCWFNSVMVAITNTFGAQKLNEDFTDSSFGGNFECLKPVISLLDLRQGSDSSVLTNCLNSFFSDVGLGYHQDPYSFFLSMLDFINFNSELSALPPVSDINLKVHYTCRKCQSTSFMMEKENCLSLSLLDNDCSTLKELIVKYMGDDELERNCDICGNDDALTTRKLQICPSVLAVQIKRYSSDLLKSKERLIFDKTIDVADFSDHLLVDNGTMYDLRAIVTHKGDTITSGHYTTFFYEKDADIFIEVDDTKVLALTQDVDLCCGGYLALYEKSTLMLSLIHQWFPFTVVLYTIRSYLRYMSPMLHTFFMKFEELLQKQYDMKQSKIILYSLAKKLGRLYQIKEDVESSLFSLFKLFDIQNGGSCYFYAELNCFNCNYHQIHVKKYEVIEVHEISVKCVIDVVSQDLMSSECYECESISMELLSQPIFLSDFLVVKTTGKLGSLDDDYESMLRVHSFSVLSMVQENRALAIGRERCFNVDGLELNACTNECSLAGEKLVILKGESFVPMQHTFQTSDIPCVFSENLDVKTQKEMTCYLNACLKNFNFDVSPQKVLLQGIAEPSFMESFFSKLLPEVFVLCFKAVDFIACSKYSVLSKMNMKKGHKSILFCFEETFYYHEFGDCDISCIGKGITDILRKIVCILDTHRGRHSYGTTFNVEHYGLSYHLSILQMIKCIYCIVRGDDFDLVEVGNMETINIQIVALYLGLLNVYNLRSLYDSLRAKITFIDCLSVQHSLNTPLFMGCDGQLFAKEISARELFQRVADCYFQRENHELDFSLFSSISSFIMENKETVSSYYFLEGVNHNDFQQITAFVKQSSPTKLIKCLSDFYSTMLAHIPEMIVHCMIDTLSVLLLDSSNLGYVKNPISAQIKIFDYITLVVGKKLLIEYVVKSGIRLQEVKITMGQLGDF